MDSIVKTTVNRHFRDRRGLRLAFMMKKNPVRLDRRVLGWLLAFFLLTTIEADAQPPTSNSLQRADFGNQAPSLRTLPMMRVPALPIAHSNSPAPGALTPPHYCDAAVLTPSATLRAIAFGDPRSGLAVGDHGVILRSGDGGQSWQSVHSGVVCGLRDLAWLNAKQAVAIGGGVDPVTRISRGVVLITRDAGATWHPVHGQDLPLLVSLRVAVDQRGGKQIITAFGETDPVSGADHFQSNDGGRNWQAVLASDAESRPSLIAASQPKSTLSWRDSLRTSEVIGQGVLMRCIERVAENTWICAGDHGTVFRSSDGGKSWQSVRGEPAATGLLVVASQPKHLPWSLIGRESLEKRLRSQTLLLHADTDDLPALRQATMQLAGASLDVVPGDSSEPLEMLLKRYLTDVKPPILALDAELDETLKTALLQHAVAHGTEKVVEYSRHRRGESLLHDNAMLTDIGTLAGDLEDDCRLVLGQLPSGFESASEGVSLTTHYTSGSQTKYGDTLAVGIAIGRQHRFPPRDNPATRRRLQVLQGRLKQQAAIDDLCQTGFATHSGSQHETRFADSLKLLLDRTSREDRFRTAFKIVGRTAGHPLQHLVWSEIGERFGQTSAGRLAELHARTHRSSFEWEHCLGQPDRFANAEATAETTTPAFGEDNAPEGNLLPKAGAHGTVVSPFQSESAIKHSPDFSSVVQASAAMPLAGASITEASRSPRSSDNEVDLAWQMHPIRLLVDDAIKRRDLPASGETPQSDDAAWSADLQRIGDQQTEWSSLLRTHSPQVTVAPPADQPPLLDGVLDEHHWTAPALTAGRPAIAIRAAWDERFVYLAVQLPRHLLESTQKPEDLGRRDADLSGDDRIVLGIDLDGDLLTSLNLAFTPDGRTHDDLDGDDRWNPTWYIAATASEKTLSTEIAIDRASLGGNLHIGDRWFITADVVPKHSPRPQPLMPDARCRIRVDFAGPH